MLMSNKELAVKLYSAYLNGLGNMNSNSAVKGELSMPSDKEIIESVKYLTKELAAFD